MAGRAVARIGQASGALVVVCVIVLAASVVAPAVASQVKHPASTVFYVSPGGSDSNPGTQAQPFRTLDRARDAARSVPRPLHEDIVIRLLAGTYRLREPLTLEPRDSGENGYDIAYEAAPGTHPLISGGRRITGWTLFDPARGIYRARALGLRARQLYVDGHRAVRAESSLDPPGFVKTLTGYITRDRAMASWRNQSDIEVLSNWRWKSFRCPVARIADSGAGALITMAQPCWHNANVFFGPISMGSPTRIENAYELLDKPREWYLDQPDGWIYYKPAPGERIDAEDIEAAASEVLIDARGTVAQPVSHLRFDGLTFADATWMGASGPEGYADDQTGFRVTGPNQPLTLEHAEFTTRTPGNLRFAYAHHVTIRDSAFVHLGAVAVDFNTGSQDDTIVGNRFSDISAAAIQLGGVEAVDHHPTLPEEVTRDNRIANNTITKPAQEFFDAAGIFAGYTTRTTIIHNTLSDLPYTGIAIGWGWGMTDPGRFPGCTGCPFQNWTLYSTPTTSVGNRILYNKVSDYLKVLYDGGGIYSLGQQGTWFGNAELIEGNVVFGKEPSHGGNALYTDGGSRYITLRGNAAFDNPQGRDGPDGQPYGHDWGGCRPYGDITWLGNWWEFPGQTYDCQPPYPPVNVFFLNNTVIHGRGDVPASVLARAGAH